MQLTRVNHIRSLKADYKLLRLVAHRHKDLYNQALYQTRQYFFDTGDYLGHTGIYNSVKFQQVYMGLPSDSAQQIIKRVHQNYKSFFASHKKGWNARIPGYLPTDGFTTVDFIPRQLKVIGDERKEVRVTLGRSGRQSFGVDHITLPFKELPGTLKMIRLVPKLNALYFEIHYVYELEDLAEPLAQSILMGIDKGLDNFAACVSTIETAFILEGRGIKSYNQWYNKTRAEFDQKISLNPTQNMIDQRSSITILLNKPR